jgi:hypothetical protein
MCEVSMRARIRERVNLEWGWAEADTAPRRVRVGSWLVPPAIDVHFGGVDGQPELVMRLGVLDGQPQCRELCLKSTDGGRGVRALDLAAVKIESWIEDIFGLFAQEIVSEEPGRTIAVQRVGTEVAAARDMHGARKGRGARTITPALLEQVAAVYTANLSARPLQAVADSRGVSYSMASKYVRAARDAGLLPETTPGRKNA